ncbi:MFS transporter [Rathayibacter caricis]|uniref:MFS transporter n=1 Tax=Rathayibacter caricis TaxID=110936 RepID=UPI001FB4BB6B|nr:MFS transporter [Rathayibacter caricis]MCJ1696466.1 MFS transporter [Rathayibacter caricis]
MRPRPDRSPSALRTPASSWLLVAAAMAALGWGGNQFIPLMVMYRQVAGFEQTEVTLLLAVYVIGIVPGFALAGAWSDRFGRRRIMLAGVALGALASVVFTIAGTNLPGLCVARLLAGVSVAVAAVVGSSWVKELSAAAGTGARRSGIALSIGFGGGAAISGVLAQWAPDPTVLPYLVHAGVTALSLLAVLRAPETRTSSPHRRSLLGDLRVPAVYRSRFRGTVAPIAPFVFGSCGLSFAVGPSLVTGGLGTLGIAFATLVMLITLGVGTSVQLLSARIDHALRGRNGPVGTICFAVGALVLAPAALTGSPWLVLLAAPFLGAGYGICLLSGLKAVQTMAAPDDLARLTATFYTLTYLGFFFPLIIAALVPVTGHVPLLIALAIAALLGGSLADHSARRLDAGLTGGHSAVGHRGSRR